MADHSESSKKLTGDDITQWIANEKRGDDPAAVQRIWDRFFDKMVGVAQRKMASMPKSVRDEEDVALSAMKSFFVGAEAGKYDLKSRDELWRLLVTITIRKANAERRRQKAARRGGADATVRPSNEESPNPLDQIVDQNRMPELIDDVMKACSELLETLDDPTLRRTAEMKMQGCSVNEISSVLGCTKEKTKYRLKKIRDLWRAYYQDRD